MRLMTKRAIYLERLRRLLPRWGFAVGMFLPLSGIAVPGHDTAYKTESLARIRQSVQAYVEAKIANGPGETSITIGTLDPRLRLPRCTAPLDVLHRAPNAATSQIRLTVQCNGEKPWTLYVPVEVRRKLPVVVAANAIARGMPMSADVLRLEVREVTGGAQHYYLDPTDLAGTAARRMLQPGEVIDSNDISTLKLVKRGQKVALTTHAAGLEVRTTGVAMADGGKGDRIPVRNPRSKRVIYGRVSGDGEVEVRKDQGSS